MSRRPFHWPLLVAALSGLPVLYVASFGPACWISQRIAFSRQAVSFLYAPLLDYVLDDYIVEMTVVNDSAELKSAEPEKTGIRGALYSFARLGAQFGMHPSKTRNGIHWHCNWWEVLNSTPPLPPATLREYGMPMPTAVEP